MKTSHVAVHLLLVLLLSGAVGFATELEDVLERHIEARGGEQAWAAVKGMKVTGDFTAFSLTTPFEMYRMQPAKLYLDHVRGGKRIVVGIDGQQVWWDNEMILAGPREVDGLDLSVLRRRAPMPNVLFAVARGEVKARLLGPSEADGQSTIAIEVTHVDEAVETWHLDPETYLEYACTSQGSDFGRPVEQWRFFDDFREVGQVVIPHLIEDQWYTRNHVMEITSVELNPEIAKDLFDLPPPPGMAQFLNLAGDWKVALSSRFSPGAPWSEGERTSTIKADLGGALMEESYLSTDGDSVRRWLAYDLFRKTYRLTEISAATRFLDIFEGMADENGRLLLSNEEAGTSTNMYGMEIFTRIGFAIGEDGGFSTEQEASVDGGESWFVMEKAVYTRADQ